MDAQFQVSDASLTCAIGTLPNVECRILTCPMTVAGSNAVFKINQWVVEADTEIPAGDGKTTKIKKDTSKITLSVDGWPQAANNSTNFMIINFEVISNSLDKLVSTEINLNGINLIMKGLGGVYTNSYKKYTDATTFTELKGDMYKDDTDPTNISISLRMQMGFKFE